MKKVILTSVLVTALSLASCVSGDSTKPTTTTDSTAVACEDTCKNTCNKVVDSTVVPPVETMSVVATSTTH